MLFYGFGTNPGYKLQEYQKTQLMQVKPNTKSVIQISSSPKCYICEIDKDFTVVKFTKLPITYNKQEYKFTTTANTKYISLRLGIQDSNYTSYEFTDIQIEENEEATDYVEHQEDTQVTYIDKPLCGIGNVRDELDYTNKKITRRFDYCEFSGADSENWILDTEFTNCIRFRKSVASLKAAVGPVAMCTHFEYLNNYSADKEHFYIYNNVLYVFVLKTVASTLADFKALIASNPIKIVYELATPIVEDIECSDKIAQYDEQTTVYNTDGAEIEVSLTNNKAIAQINQNLQRIEELLAKIGGE